MKKQPGFYPLFLFLSCTLIVGFSARQTGPVSDTAGTVGSVLAGAAPTDAAVSGESGSVTGDAGSAKPARQVKPPRRKPVDHKVVVMLGPLYADRPAVTESLLAEYGVAGYGGMVELMPYPAAFTRNGLVRLSDLTDAVRSPGVTILVTVGAPEKTVTELNKLRADRRPLSVISVFPSDEYLPVEAVSDLVLDRSLSGEPLADEESSLIPDADLGVLLLAAVLSGEEKDGSISPQLRLETSLDSAKILAHQKKSCAGWSFSPWIDPETGLRSRNHLVLATAAPARPDSGGGSE